VVDAKVAEHEEAAHEKRNWVRLTFDCNNHCVFCLDTLTHDGQMRDANEVRDQILDGRKKGATRLILSGGEPTMHPRYHDFIKLGRLAGYPRVQTVTNGRMFSYPEFLGHALDAGLTEITFSIHGPNAKLHDALVGVKGAFDQEVQGLKNALASGRVVVNIDVVVNRANVKHLKEILDTFIAIGVKEFDLLQVIPFGNAFTEGRDVLFYDLAEMRPYLVEAFSYARRKDIHIWVNRFPVQHLESFEFLIQDPYKLNDEVRGRKEEFGRLLETGVPLDCREPACCRYCYLERLCDTLEGVRATVAGRRFEVVRADSEWEARQEPVFGGDPASRKKTLPETVTPIDGRVHLRLAGSEPVPAIPPEALAREAGARRVHAVAPSLAHALEVAARYPVPELSLELDDWDGFDGTAPDKRVVQVVARTAADARRLLAIAGDFEVLVHLTRETTAWLLGLDAVSPRLALLQPTYERLTEAAERDADLRAFFERFPHPIPVEGVPACVIGRAPRTRPATLDSAMMTPGGRIEIFRYAKRYILEHYRAKSLRCRECVHDTSCDGMQINWIRAHGYQLMQPVHA
jgi:MoaA/NifB/PqqE/SkfB family radical SAM enzyme